MNIALGPTSTVFKISFNCYFGQNRSIKETFFSALEESANVSASISLSELTMVKPTINWQCKNFLNENSLERYKHYLFGLFEK